MSGPVHRIAAACLALPLALALGFGAGGAAAGMLQGESTTVPVETKAQRYWLTFERTEEGLTLGGQVPDQLTETVLTTYAAALFGANKVHGDLSPKPAGPPAPPDWTKMAMAAADTLAEVPSGTATVTTGAVRVTGAVVAPEDAGQLTRALRDKLGPGIRVSTEFAVEVPDLVSTFTYSPERCAWLMTRLAAQRQILFDTGSAAIEEGSLPGIGAIAELFGRCPEAEIEVTGYTDSEGDEDYNLDLSQARAESVMKALLEAGIPLRRLRARGLGEADPIASNDTESGRARNRRIEFRAVR